MTAKNDFKILLIEEDLGKAVFAAENLLKENYIDEDDEPWGADNHLEVSSIPYFFKQLTEDGALPQNLLVQFTLFDDDASYLESRTRFIVFDDITPIFVIPCQQVVGVNSKTSLTGLAKEGFEKIAEAMFVYSHLGISSLQTK